MAVSLSDDRSESESTTGMGNDTEGELDLSGFSNVTGDQSGSWMDMEGGSNSQGLFDFILS